MKSKYWIIFGTLLSMVLLTVIFARLDWQDFLSSLKTINIQGLVLAMCIAVVNIVLRSLRWNLVADLPLAHFKHFWQAVNIGYLGNMIYPARAGEVLKMVAIHHFTSLVPGRAVTSVVIDRMLDLMMAGVSTLIVLWLHSNRIDSKIGTSVISIFLLTTLVLTLLIFSVNYLHLKARHWKIPARWQRAQEWYLHALEGVQVFRQPHNLLTILPLTIFIFLIDYYIIWQVMFAFNWSLPFEAALTVGVFIVIGISLPSVPAYIGIYQIACVLALKLYGIPESPAVAYSIVLQLLSFGIIGVQGTLVMIYCGFNLSRERQSGVQEFRSSEVNQAWRVDK
jgi:uncharacterized protein (TIRG00374 family)